MRLANRAPPRPLVPSPSVSTRGLIITALVCGLAILVAFAVQLLVAG